MADVRAFLASPPYDGHDPDLSAFHDLAERVIVVGAGPSAPDHYGWIRDQYAPVIAPSTMLLPLQHAGIDVDYTCIIDPGTVMKLHFMSAETQRALIYLRSVIGDVPRLWRGRRFVIDAPPGPSVIHLCVEVALKMGAKQVHLVGCDFSYPDKRSHAEGVVTSFPVDPRLCMLAGCASGGCVPTDGELLEHRRVIEHMIADNPTANFIAHGKRGLPIAGAVYD